MHASALASRRNMQDKHARGGQTRGLELQWFITHHFSALIMINWIESVVAPHINKKNYQSICEIGSSTGAASDKLLQLTKSDITIIDPCIDVDLIGKFQTISRVRIIKGLSLDVLPSIAETFDCILIDGDHNWYTVYNELQAIDKYDLLRPGGTIFFHDVGWPYGRRDMYYSLDSIPSEFVQPHSRGGVIRGQSALISGLSWPHDVALVEGGPRNGVLTGIEDFYKEHAQSYGFFACPSVESGLGVLWKKNPSSQDNSFLQLRLQLLRMSLANTSPTTVIQGIKKSIKTLLS